MAESLNFSEHRPEPEPLRVTPAPSPEALPEDAAFTFYLDQVCARLEALAPSEWIADLRAELACHLECTAEAYEELGETRELAVESACRSLGNPAKLGKRWEGYWQEKRPEPFRRTFQLAFCRFAPAAAAAPFLLQLSWWNPLRQISPVVALCADLLTFFTVLFLPMVVGTAFARRSRGRLLPATCAAVLTVAALMALLRFVPGDDPLGLQSDLWQLYVIYWLPLGSAAAGITGLVRSRRERRRLQRGA